jgi:RNA polymerase sigma-70 factor (ECF subfamily)
VPINTPRVALSDVFIEHRPQLRNIARRIVGTPELADDITQEAFLRLADGAGIRDIEKPFCYCCQVVRNLALDHCRRQSVEATYRVYTDDGELPQVSGGTMAEQGLDERRVLRAIDKVLSDLPARTRKVFEMYRLSGLTQREIGKELGCSATLVNFMLKDAANAIAGCRDLLEF